MLTHCPKKLIDKVIRAQQSPSKQPISRQYTEGNRNTLLASIFGSQKHNGVSKENAKLKCHALNDNSENPLPGAEVNSVADSIYHYKDDPLSNLSEMNVARMFAEEHKHILCVSPGDGYFLYNGKVWQLDCEDLKTQELIKDYCRIISTALRIKAKEATEKEAKRLRGLAHKFQTKAMMTNLIKLIKSEAILRIETDRFDNNKNLLNCQNGTYDLINHKLINHDPKHYLTQITPIDFNQNANSLVFDQFLEDILPKHHESFILRLMASSLLGDPKDHVLPIINGDGQNGKSVFMNCILYILGDYAANINTSSLMVKKDTGNTNDIARLRGKRCVAASETSHGGILDAAAIKKMTGEDTLTARPLYKEYFEFEPEFIVFMVTNFLPILNGADAALARRLILIKFDRRIEDSKVDRNLKTKLRNETSGIFNRLLEGLKDYQKHGLMIPDDIKAASESFMNDSNMIKRFIDESIENNASKKLRASILQFEYVSWCGHNRIKPLSAPLFKREFSKVLGLVSKRDTDGYYWPGIKLKI